MIPECQHRLSFRPASLRAFHPGTCSFICSVSAPPAGKLCHAHPWKVLLNRKPGKPEQPASMAHCKDRDACICGAGALPAVIWYTPPGYKLRLKFCKGGNRRDRKSPFSPGISVVPSLLLAACPLCLGMSDTSASAWGLLEPPSSQKPPLCSLHGLVAESIPARSPTWKLIRSLPSLTPHPSQVHQCPEAHPAAHA